ncbi:MAG: hypothetical protein LBV67_07600 [Streptococcaceae bacterium]|nr:hypothetical protein [Streptococcaceae bacterium]
MHTIMNGRFEGKSELVQVVQSDEELAEFANLHEIKYMSESEYTKKILKNTKLEFYNYE